MSLSSKLSIDDIDPKGKTVLIRVDFNVPLKDGAVSDTTRIDEALPTLHSLFERGAAKLVLLTHLGRPDGKVNAKYSAKPLVPVLKQKLKREVIFVSDCVGPEVEQAVKNAPQGSVVLLENVRFHLEEEGSVKDKAGNKIKATKQQIDAFRASLSKLGDIYVNDAFGTAHRAHSSVVGINLPVRAAGYLMKKELKCLGSAIENPARPYLAIMGGAKVSDKIQLISNLLDKVDEMIIGGGMAFTFKKVIDGVKIGKSLYDEKGATIVKELVEKARVRGVRLHFPIDYRVANKFSSEAKVELATDATGIPDDWMALDAGPKTNTRNAQVIWRAKTIIVNGPMGVFEFAAFSSGTESCLQAVAAATQLCGATSVIGGGDSAAAAKQFGIDKLVTHVSTGGGASLELLEGKTLPGIQALSQKQQNINSKL